MKARHDWSPQARDQFFGPEPMARDPLPVHSEAVERCRSVLGEAHHESLRALSSNEATTYLLEVVEGAAITCIQPQVGQIAENGAESP